MTESRLEKVGQDRLRQVIAKEFEMRQAHNPRYSLRSFAKKLGVSNASLSQYLNGRRDLAPASVSSAMQALYPDRLERQQVFLSLNQRNGGSTYSAIGVDSFEMISDWYYMALIHLAEARCFKADPKVIAKRFNLSVDTIGRAIARLRQHGFLKVADGHLVATKKPFIVESAHGSQAIRGFHRQNLHLAIDALESVPPGERDFSYISILTSKKKIKMVRDQIRKFREKMARQLQLSDEVGEDLYAMCIQLFPLTDRATDQER